MMRLFITCLMVGAASGFVVRAPRFSPVLVLSSSKENDGDANLQQALPVGAIVEFEEKKRVHIGTIESAEHKSNGGARYKVEDTEGHVFNIADKAVTFSTPAPNSPKKKEELLTELSSVQEVSEDALCNMLDVSPELLEMAWEEAADDEAPVHELTAKSFINLVHSHAASAKEEYMAWKLLKGEMAHVFFKEMKKNGRVLSFKAKARKAVDNAKVAFCASHGDEAEFCVVG